MRGYRLIAALAAFSWPCWADTISFSDDTFAISDWSLTELADTSVDGQGSASQSLTGGNPGAFYNGKHSWQGAGHIRYGHTFSPSGGAMVDPSAGAITSIDFAFDLELIDGTFGPIGGTQATLGDTVIVFYYLIEQGGDYYLSGFDFSLIYKSDGWKSYSASGLTASDFLKMNRTTGLFEASESPDFSTGGDALSFGFAQANSNPSNTPSSNVVFMDWGVDNWSVTVTTDSGGGTDPVPEPGTFALFGAALIGFAVYRRRRATS